MKFLGVDLAASSSAAVLINSAGKVEYGFDSFALSDKVWVDRIIDTAIASPTLLLVEDLPYHIPYRLSVKDVLRLQGRIIAQAEVYGLFTPRFVNPATWQQTFNGVWRGGPKGAQMAALADGYEMPDLLATDKRFDLTGLKGKDRSKLRERGKKLATDYVDAYLIARWAFLQFPSGVIPPQTQGVEWPRTGALF